MAVDTNIFTDYCNLDQTGNYDPGSEKQIVYSSNNLANQVIRIFKTNTDLNELHQLTCRQLTDPSTIKCHYVLVDRSIPLYFNTYSQSETSNVPNSVLQ